jgi:hypothetical protein
MTNSGGNPQKKHIKNTKIYSLMDAKLVNIHREIITYVIPSMYAVHFYGQGSFALLSVLYNLEGCKIVQRKGPNP